MCTQLPYCTTREPRCELWGLMSIILGALLEKYFADNNRALYLLRLSSWALLGALGRFLVKV
jgi:hypothetical protein